MNFNTHYGSPEKIALAQQRYSPEDFVDDLMYLLQETPNLERDDRTQLLEDYFYKKYPDSSHAAENSTRLVLALNYFMSHYDEFCESEFGVSGESGSLIQHHLIYALYRIFGIAKTEQLSQDFL